MADGRGRARWQHTSALLAMLANVNRDPKKTRAFKPRDFDPYSARKKREKAIQVTDMAILKEAFKGRRPR